MRSAVDNRNANSKPAPAWSLTGRTRQTIDERDLFSGGSLLAVASPPRRDRINDDEPTRIVPPGPRRIGGLAARVGI